MRSISLFFAAALLCAQPPARVQTGYDSIQPAGLKADLTFLSSDALEGRMSLQHGSEIAIQWIASVFAGYGISAPELNYDDYAGIDARGKIVLIFNHEPQEADANSVFNGIGNTRYTNNNYKLFNAERHGAIAVLTMPDPNHQGPVRGGGAATAGQAPAAGRG